MGSGAGIGSCQVPGLVERAVGAWASRRCEQQNQQQQHHHVADRYGLGSEVDSLELPAGDVLGLVAAPPAPPAPAAGAARGSMHSRTPPATGGRPAAQQRAVTRAWGSPEGPVARVPPGGGQPQDHLFSNPLYDPTGASGSPVLSFM